MAASTTPRLFLSFSFLSRRRGFFFLPVFLAFISSVFLLLSSTSKLYIHPTQTRLHLNPPLESSKVNTPMHSQGRFENRSLITSKEPVVRHENITSVGLQEPAQVSVPRISRPHHPIKVRSVEAHNKNDNVFHVRSLFMKDYKEMNKSFKIYAYPHRKNEPFANVLLPVDSAPGGNYASESYFKKALFKSQFLTSDPSEADLFYLPFSIASLRNDPRVGVGGIKDFIRDYISNISRNYPFWNRTGGADHFYVACHSIGRTAMDKAVQVRLNAIQVVCSSSYFLAGYVSHKDASIPQIWPREGRAPTRSPSERKKLAFYAGAMNSRVREFLVKTWENDSDISVHQSRLKTPYSEALLGSKFCIHAKGFEINTARIGDALYYGCVPVVLADHYDLPYADVLNWNSFAVVLSTSDIPMLKKILQGISNTGYVKLQRNVMRVQMHFQWHNVPVDYDAFHMVMYELWLRRSHLRIN
ncbi:probable glycosyltransferase at5g03795 [Phtheirospermum japonicum]|uniref:Probable glycosyltransferase at5g03795 n=1 Tax=Phtheirospermum japonicum TaxID=374723 RepID=A0A830CPK9_9LAMI|nr:probable glycosyltransferase at5g03795 [Phtheirospermum japonicum]